ncbi:MAG: tRNA preQ1(34) S-adenosylmethionine ribosyltransferase-isomerase QueA [Bacilli bacterium]|nr:tRNA preQ1(34) S-adenosylmethionine ribosyltransferase-isomerase QueA [Bacilli bacterium]
MKTEEYNYVLNKNLIAQSPLKKRSDSKLMVLDKKTGVIEHKNFYQIIDYLNKGDALVINNTKVMPARLLGIKKATGAIIEILLLKNIVGDTWEVLAKPQKRLKKGIIITFGDILKGEIIDLKEDGITIIKLIYKGILMEVLEKLGTMPLPPYITKKLKNQDRYQTVYAKEYGSSAAPTAGLHFTPELLNQIKAKGINIVNITLHVGLGTFRPVMVDDITKHEMHSEYYILDKEAADTLNKVNEEGGSIIAVGTTSVRTLETVMQNNKKFIPSSGETKIFIYPSYEFKAVDKLITNFHLPKSTLLMLVSALATKEYILNAYNIATKCNYRFFSFGDAMFIK